MPPKAKQDVPASVETLTRDAILANTEYERNAQKNDDEIARERLQGIEERALQRKRGDIQQLLKMPEFRRFCWRVMELGQPYAPTFVPGQPDSSAFNEGKRANSVEVLKWILEANPEAYLMMQKEALSDQKSEDARNRKTESES